eukprot:m.78445 g.78445  ORF g.78445 m.78445 type:complete len:55 (+) comp16233_c0_seq1:676-840(+)
MRSCCASCLSNALNAEGMHGNCIVPTSCPILGIEERYFAEQSRLSEQRKCNETY